MQSSPFRAGLFTFSRAATPSSTFVYDGGAGRNLTIAVNVPSLTDDLYFHMSGPAGFDWLALGFGEQMKGSLMLIVYKAENERDITVSPRLASGNSEPTYTKDVTVTLMPGHGVVNGTVVVNGRCTGCRKWNGGAVDVKSTTQPMIYAVGPDEGFRSNAPDAGLRRHGDYGESSLQRSSSPPDCVPLLYHIRNRGVSF